jgi:PAS domain S-box-containing protein
MASRFPDPSQFSGDSNLPKQSIMPTEAKPEENALPESERRRLVALEASGIGTWSWNFTTNEIAWDSRCKALFGLPDTAPNTMFEEFFSRLHPDDRKAAEEAIQKVLDGKGEYDAIHRVIWPDGSVHWLRCRGQYVKGLSKEVVGSSVEVTWLKRSEEDHFQKEELLRRAHDELDRRVQERTAELEQRTAEVVQQARLLDLANDGIFVRGADDRISYWNEGAERLYGWSQEEAVGQSPHDLLHTEFPIPIAEILNMDRWEGELRHTKRDGTKITVASRWTTLRDQQGKPVGWLELNSDISARKTAEEAAMRLTSRILSLQDTERRRIARELHDCLGQYLAALKMNLDQMKLDQMNLDQMKLDQLTTEASEDGEVTARKLKQLSECSEIVERCLTETRTLSHLMHPPLLDEAGLASAIRWYVEGFVERSGIEVNLNLPSVLPRLRSNMELALFRVLQESLTNVHRHAACSLVEISIAVNAGEVSLKVKDNGSGIAADRLRSLREGGAEVGIGLAVMRERVRDLGGHLDLDSDASGTTVTAVMPILLAASESDEQSHISGIAV